MEALKASLGQRPDEEAERKPPKRAGRKEEEAGEAPAKPAGKRGKAAK
jgi:hypothetical protein